MIRQHAETALISRKKLLKPGDFVVHDCIRQFGVGIVVSVSFISLKDKRARYYKQEVQVLWSC